MLRRKRILSVVTFLCIMMLFSPAAQAQGGGASLSVGSGSGMPGDAGMMIPVRLNPDDGVGVTGLNFDLSFDASRLTVQNVSIGGAASSAGKTVSWTSPSSGRIRVIIFGLNQTVISDGTVADISFNVNPGASPGSSSLSLSNATATDLNGNAVALSLSSGTFTVTSPPSPPTATDTSAPPVPTATSTAAPKTLPSQTPTPTNTSQPSPTRTATNTAVPSNTPQSTSTSVPATATRTVTATPTRTATSTAISTSTTSGTATDTGQITGNATETGTSTTDASIFSETTATPTPTIDALLLAYVDPIEAAVVATSTALAAQAESQMNVNPPSSAIDEAGNPPPALTQGLSKVPGSLADNTKLLTILIFGAGIAGTLLLTPLAIHLVRVRIQKANPMGPKSRAPSDPRPKDEPLWRQ